MNDDQQLKRQVNLDFYIMNKRKQLNTSEMVKVNYMNQKIEQKSDDCVEQQSTFDFSFKYE